jgi:periplasmic protein TonB
MDFILVMHLFIESNPITNIKNCIMKNQFFFGKTETLEEIVFEGRNKSYGAFELNQKRSKYLFTAFFIAFLGVSAVIAVPFIHSFNIGDTPVAVKKVTEVILTEIVYPEFTPPPPLPPINEEVFKRVVFNTPVIVEELTDPTVEFEYEVIELVNSNPPVDIELEVVPPSQDAINEPPELPVFNPQEKASFKGGDEDDFRKWVAENIVFPEIAAKAGIKGKVIIEFCVNSKGEVVDIIMLKKLDPAIDAETLRVISSSPRWTPAKQGGSPVKQRFTIPFMFDLI